MPYITTKYMPRYRQVDFDDILFGEIEWNNDFFEPSKPDESATTTRYVADISWDMLRRTNFNRMISSMKNFYDKYEHLYKVPRKELYHSFSIPKKSGGWRPIDAPKPELMSALKELKILFETELFALHHTTAYAYIKGRAPINAMQRHQANNSRWFLKLDFSNFFGSTSYQFAISILTEIFPFCEIVKRIQGKQLLEKLIDLCMLDGVLPQGTPISPMLTNLLMIPIDYEINKKMREGRFVYTRYADDMQISHYNDFKTSDVQKTIVEVLKKFNAPYVINNEKTRYGSSSGKNWNLGLMYNKDAEITVGHEKKKQMRAMIHNFILDTKSGIEWDIARVQKMNGLISYYHMVEPDYVDMVIVKSNHQYDVDIKGMIHKILAAD